MFHKVKIYIKILSKKWKWKFEYERPQITRVNDINMKIVFSVHSV